MTTPTPGFDPSPTTGLSGNDVLDAANAMLQMKVQENVRLDRISKYMRGRHDPPYTPRGASTEYRWLTKRAKDNFLPLIVSVISQNLHVDGFRPSGSGPDDYDSEVDPTGDTGWSAWMANRMISKQHGINRAVVKYGAAYALVVPGRIAQTDPATGNVQDKSMAVINAFSPRRMLALYADDVTDEWPMLAMTENVYNDPSAPGKARRIVTLYDDTNRYILVGNMGRQQTKLAWPSQDDPMMAGKSAVSLHGMGICPISRFTYEVDLDSDEDCIGEVDPLISLQDQVNFHTFNQLLAEQFAAYRQRYVTGMVPVDETGRGDKPFRPGVDRLWVGEDSDTRFGEFSETNLTPILDSREATIRHMSTLSQIPPYHLLGSLVNLSADALSAARDGMDNKIAELQSVLTDPYRNVFRLCSKAQGDNDGWEDLHGQVMWRDTSARSFAATIDGLGKAAQMLGVPAHELWRRIPGVTAEDVATWKAAAMNAEAMAKIDSTVQAALTAGAMTGPPTADQPYQLGTIGKAPPAPPAKPGAASPDPGAAQPPGNAAVPPGAPGNAAPDAGKSGNPPASSNGVVHVPAHTRAAPTTPGS